MKSQETLISGYVVRRFLPDDAADVTDCVRRVYGGSYRVHPELYHPEQIVNLNERGELVSFVAEVPDGSLAGHYAIERPGLGPIGETGEAIVLPEHRHHHLLERMRALLVTEARRLGMLGLYGQPVTNHVFSQKMYEHYEGFPCAISLALLPTTFHNLPEPLLQRLSCLMYFQYLKQPERVRLHVPPQHRAMIERIYAQFGIVVEVPEPAEPAGLGVLDVAFEPELQMGFLRMGRVGADSAGALRQAQRQLLDEAKAEMLLLELPLAQAATPAMCRAAEEMGFFFSGVGPHFAADGDVLRLGFLATAFDPAQLQIFNPFAQELTAYAVREWQRVRGK